jgi:hypothetical protein
MSMRGNDGSWYVTIPGVGQIASVAFKGSAKRGTAHEAPDLEGMANARLIASAPELVAALKALVIQLDGTTSPGQTLHDYVENARSALQKAGAK